MVASPDYCLFYSESYFPCMSQGEWASWAQAVFSVLAIVVAIGIALYQVNRQHVRQRAVDVAAAKVFAAGWTVIISMGSEIALEIKDKCTESIRLQRPVGLNEIRKRVGEIVLPSESQMLRLSAATPQGAVALANATVYLTILQRSLEIGATPRGGPIELERYQELKVRIIRRWIKLTYVNLRVAYDHLLPFMYDKSEQLSWVRRIFYRLNPAAERAAIERNMIEDGWVNSIPLEADTPAGQDVDLKAAE